MAKKRELLIVSRLLTILAFTASIFLAPFSLHCQENLIVNDTFQLGDNGQLFGWNPLWMESENSGSLEVEDGTGPTGLGALHVQHHAATYWTVSQSLHVPVLPGELLILSGWVKSASDGEAELSLIVRDSFGEAIHWSLSPISVGGKHEWADYRRKFVVPKGGATVQFRVVGRGDAELRLSEPSLVRAGFILGAPEENGEAEPAPLKFSNRMLEAACALKTGALSVVDKRSGAVWVQEVFSDELAILEAEQQNARTISLRMLYLPTGAELTALFTVSQSQPELSVEISGDTSLSKSLSFPHPFSTQMAHPVWFAIPMNEGILYPVHDAALPPMHLIAYGGHGICMPWYGQVTGATPDSPAALGVMTLFNTPDDASVDIHRPDGGRLVASPRWNPSRGFLRYSRKLTYYFTSEGGYVAQAKLYRGYAKEIGLFKTLAQKREENPYVDLLIGAVNIWNFDMPKVPLCEELKALGMDKVLWSAGGSPSEIDAINAMGYLSSRYDIYQDVWPPDVPADVKKAGWPEELVLLPNGDWMRGWSFTQRNSDGTETAYQGGVISSPCGLKRAKEEITADLKTHAYRGRFIDTTTASPFREDYNLAHPLTRTEDRQFKMALLDFCSNDKHLVVGSETGIDPAVPYLHYFEGMMSLGPYRLPDAGTDLLGYRTPTPEFLKFMVGPSYRIPLWELVYHDCIVSQWYWGDSSNKAPEVWDKRDLINILYATPPLFMMDREIWNKYKERFIKSYEAVCPVARRFGYDEMLSHRYLTEDRTVQGTTWLSGFEIIVNMGDKPHQFVDGTTLNAGEWTIH